MPRPRVGRFYPVGTKSVAIKCVFGDMKRFVFLAIVGLIYANNPPTCADRFKISLCRLRKTNDFNFSIKKLSNENSVPVCFVNGEPDIQSVSEIAEVTGKSEHPVSFDISGRNLIIENDGTVTIDNENVEDRFYVSAVSLTPFPPVVLAYNRDWIAYVPYKAKDTWIHAEKDGFTITHSDEWFQKRYEDACKGTASKKR